MTDETKFMREEATPHLAPSLWASLWASLLASLCGRLCGEVDVTSEENTLDAKDVIECLEQSMYGVTFDAPPNDGVVTVTYPLVFAPGDGG